MRLYRSLDDQVALEPGDYFLTQITGFGGLLIRVAQGLAGDWSRYTHTGIYLGDGTVIAAQPGGARIDPIESILEMRPLAISVTGLEPHRREEIVALARSLEGRPYSFLDYLSIALVTLGIRPKWLLRYVESTGHMICSQLVDYVYEQCGVDLFDDGRPHGDVTPGDLAHVGTIRHVGAGPVRHNLDPAAVV